MIVVSVELHSARTGEKILLGQTIIHNVGGTADSGDYEVKVGHKNNVGDLRKIFHKPLRTGSVIGHARLSANIWTLVAKALCSAFPETKK
jgi:hypothetical protein